MDLIGRDVHLVEVAIRDDDAGTRHQMLAIIPRREVNCVAYTLFASSPFRLGEFVYHMDDEYECEFLVLDEVRCGSRDVFRAMGYSPLIVSARVWEELQCMRSDHNPVVFTEFLMDWMPVPPPGKKPRASKKAVRSKRK
jgi:hypothetical protein